jgi:hypothetical protein
MLAMLATTLRAVNHPQAKEASEVGWSITDVVFSEEYSNAYS